jgi:hypothetical protein
MLKPGFEKGIIEDTKFQEEKNSTFSPYQSQSPLRLPRQSEAFPFLLRGEKH